MAHRCARLRTTTIDCAIFIAHPCSGCWVRAALKNVDRSDWRTRHCIRVDSAAIMAATTAVDHCTGRIAGIGTLSRIYGGDRRYGTHVIGSRECTTQSKNNYHVESKHFDYPTVVVCGCRIMAMTAAIRATIPDAVIYWFVR